ncbi:Rrf2 family transcriptional regulator [Geothrix limicola]|uniref:Rrf2 family transcriptional regulator n=1 Tax=Geothrix limicola TaxID=2927978 RepID=A0ABQ5QBT3_9BACT|nr:Rrf2 family transcriptional regulator [Geothrix limicola]GLH72277.1 Rrf2 family transcriptional regulator [Geothrix limicola]
MHHSDPGLPPSRSLFHAPTRYALQALVRMPHDGTYRLARSLARELGLPGPFLAKILQTLGHAGILESHRGPSGGFRLNRAPEHISLKEIVVAMEGPEPFEACLLGHHGGEDGCRCPIRPTWDILQNLLTTVLATTSLRDLQSSQDWSHRPDDPDRPFAAPV